MMFTYILMKEFERILIHIRKIFICSVSFKMMLSISPLYSYLELGQSDFYSFSQEKVSYLLIYLLTTH